MKILLTGAFGFVGWHTRLHLELVAGHQVTPVGRNDWSRLSDMVGDVDAIIHVAGVNRGSAAEVERGNVRLAEDVATALAAARPGSSVIFANSIQAGSASPYGEGKARASEVLAASAARHGHRYVDVRLPNLFGEHGRPHYNSFVSTFIASIVSGETPRIDDRELSLMHVQQAAWQLLDATVGSPTGVVELHGTITTVRAIFDQLSSFHQSYRESDLPPLTTGWDVDLFNTYRSALFPSYYPIALPSRADHRGNLVEVVRARGAGGHTFVSTSRPGVIRGDHFHVHKIERFVVLRGEAQINLRRLYDSEVVSFAVDGRRPCVVDMPTLWSHNIVNVGQEELTTLFWSNELFDPQRPDTVPHPVIQPTWLGSST